MTHAKRLHTDQENLEASEEKINESIERLDEDSNYWVRLDCKDSGEESFLRAWKKKDYQIEFGTESGEEPSLFRAFKSNKDQVLEMFWDLLEGETPDLRTWMDVSDEYQKF